MKRTFITLVILLITQFVFAQPGYEIVTGPTNVATTYYDYQPGSYNGIPMHIQPAISQPNGFSAGGVYIAYHAQETLDGNRRAFFTYIDENGEIVTTAPISDNNLYEGYLGIDIDPVTADPFVAWHVDLDDDDPQEVPVSYDFFHFSGGAGLWSDLDIVIDNGNIPTQYPDDKFIWPNVNIGPSPQGAEYRRIYVVSTNATDHGLGSAHNPVIAYADFTTEDLDNMIPFNWTLRSIPQMDEWDSDDPELQTQSKIAFVTSKVDGKVAIFGWNVQYGFIAFINNNYGEGDFTFYNDEFKKYVENPQNLDGSYRFSDDDGNPYEDMNFFFRYSGYFNADFIDNETKISFIGNMGLQTEYNGDNLWWEYCIYPKQFYFDLETEEFGLVDIYPQGANPNDDQPMLPWDLDEDGLPDEYDEDGNVLFEEGWPFFYHLSSASNSLYKFAKNEEKGWMAAIWHDGLNAKKANNDIPGYEEWLEAPELAISISADFGVTWSEPIFMNANPNDENYVEEFADMIPSYANPSDYIEEIDETHGKLHLFFLDDNSYGSYVLGHGLQNGGMLKYAALNIEFPDNTNSEETINPTTVTRLKQNYPNPFNPTTSISFELAKGEEVDAELIIYNMRGQVIDKFSELEKRGGAITWNGKDKSGKKVSSGVYLYKLQTANRSEVRKMLLLK